METRAGMSFPASSPAPLAGVQEQRNECKRPSNETSENRFIWHLSVRSPQPCPGESLHAGSFTWGCMVGWIFGDLCGDHVETQSTCYDLSHIPFPLTPQEVPYILFLRAACLAGCPLQWVFQDDSSLRIRALAHEKQDVPLPCCPFSSPRAALSGQWNASHSPSVCPVSWVILLWTLLSWLGGWKGRRKHPLQRPVGETSSG